MQVKRIAMALVQDKTRRLEFGLKLNINDKKNNIVKTFTIIVE